MKKKTFIGLIFLLCSTLLAWPVDPTTEADYLIITHTELDQGIWLTDLITLQEGRGFQVGVQYVQDGVTKVQKNA